MVCSKRSSLLVAAQLFGLAAAAGGSVAGDEGAPVDPGPVARPESEPSCLVGGSCDADGSAYLQTRSGVTPSVSAGAKSSAPAAGEYPMCAMAAQMCSAFQHTTTGSVGYEGLSKALHSGGALEAFLTMKGIKFGKDGMLNCETLCEAGVDHLKAANVVMPPAPDIGCYPTDPSDLEGSVVCDFDLSPAAMMKVFADHPPDLPASRGPAGSASLLQQVQGLKPAAGGKDFAGLLQHLRERLSTKTGGSPYEPSTYGFQKEANQEVNNVALRILYLFRVYPKAWVTYTPDDGLAAVPPGQTEPWPTLVAKNNLVSRAYLNAVTLLLMAAPDASADCLTRWFGEDAATNPSSRGEVMRMLSAITELLNTAVIVYSPTDPRCPDGVYAFVYPYGLQGVPTASYAPRRGEQGIGSSPSGTKVMNFCNFYFAYPKKPFTFSHGLWESVQTFIHEASHHGPAFTTDVQVCEEYTYLNVKTSVLSGIDSMQVVTQSTILIDGATWLSAANASLSGSLEKISPEGMYAGSIVRFSEDGEYTLFEVGPPRQPQSCGTLAYGQATCKALAKTQPYKALLNADSFGYFIVEMAEHFFTTESQLVP